ncbi:hypothetical protein HYALB_00010436 [Hymenoscyphus albidus]|uniref:Uncharacterized protein n=1 Tax=Hymenoscyphus albidus TaxID=595503 RepID=A0A9N9LL79_9HELO|nr:hypothetical protein HYALB_00010436 [Hymenoscyphus albidus]
MRIQELEEKQSPKERKEDALHEFSKEERRPRHKINRNKQCQTPRIPFILTSFTKRIRRINTIHHRQNEDPNQEIPLQYIIRIEINTVHPKPIPDPPNGQEQQYKFQHRDSDIRLGARERYLAECTRNVGDDSYPY